ncbi:MAG: PQQ-like beta-propeller repeat protein [Verrucomicrobiae bacterium]|nr:PQQ-like beta-propeller repeat protein [Verrucomicrobiae bacterium]
MKTLRFSILAALVLSAGISAHAADWPAYRGPDGDGISSETLPKKVVPSQPVWMVETNLGFSSFSVAAGKAYTIVIREIDGNPMEICLALDAATGEEEWAAPLWLGGQYDGGGKSGAKGNDGGDGPRSTPVISGDKVYVLDSHLRLYALNVSDGQQAWSVDLEKKYSASNIKWQNAASPVIDGDRVFVAGGGRGQSLLAFDKNDGKLLWKGENDAITHASPVVADLLGVRQVIYFTQEGLVACAVEDGKVLWRQAYPFKVSTAASPVVFEDIVYCSAGYGVGGGAYKISKDGDKFASAEVWRTENDNINHWSTPVVKDGYLYGMFSFKKYGEGPLACIDIKSGEQKWAKEGYGPGNVILTADGTLVALSDSGEIVLVEAKPDAYTEISRADVLDGKCWSTPALADGKVYVRSTVQGGAFDFTK